MNIREITDHIESIAPLAYQESYDNSGLICGDPDAKVKAAFEEANRRLDAKIVEMDPVLKGYSKASS